MRTNQLLQKWLGFLAAAVVPAWVGYRLALGRFDTDLMILTALAIAGSAGYALGRGAGSLP